MTSENSARTQEITESLSLLLSRAAKRSPPLNQAMATLGSGERGFPVTVKLVADDGAWIEKTYKLGRDTGLDSALSMFRSIQGFVAGYPGVDPKRFPANGPRLPLNSLPD